MQLPKTSVKPPLDSKPIILTIDDFFTQQQNQPLLRFITCGSVDDGKSTLIGRLLWESQQLFDDQLLALENESRKFGHQGQNIDFSLLVDGLAAEREQGITIDVAYRFFATTKRKFIVADTPGHEQYTCNMITGASTADAALLLVDATHGLQTQTRRHAYLASLMGISHIVLAVNKMDLVNFNATTFTQIENDFKPYAKTLNFESIHAIPLSALKGDNLTQHSTHMPWYTASTLIAYLETVPLTKNESKNFTLPIQWVNRPHANFRGFSGSVAQGRIHVGDKVRVTASGQTAHVTQIITMDAQLPQATTGDAITLTLDKEIDASRGDVLSLANHPLEMSDQFKVTLVWMNEETGHIGRSYHIKLATQWATASITSIKHRININSLTQEAAKQIELNEICVCNLATSKPLVYESYKQSKTLGGFILVDRYTHATVAAGMIHHHLNRAQNIHRQTLSITRTDREQLGGHKGKVIWLTGLSGSGKTTIANELEKELHAQGKRTYILDGDNIRQHLNKDLGFTDADRIENIRRVTEVAKLMMDAGLIVITAFISPFRSEREMAREIIGTENFIEVLVDTPLSECENRDPKGLYKKARAGALSNMTGISSPYEKPTCADIVLDGCAPANQLIQILLAHLKCNEA